MSSKNIPNLLREREINTGVNRKFQTKLQVYDQLVNHLGLETELQGHEGCVNCLEWNKDGNLLASGSDDHHAIIWDPYHRKILHRISTGHNGNIFSVKFMPNSSDHVLATGAADSQVRIHSVTSKETTQIFNCHNTRVKRLATSWDSSYLIWSASEDGTVRQFDLREPHTCPPPGTSQTCKNVLIDLNIHVGAMCEAKCIEINPCQSELIAIGCNDPYVRLYDRRMLGTHCTSESGVVHCGEETCNKEGANLPLGCVRYFTPGHLPNTARCTKKRSVVATYLTFGSDGRELLVNLGGEQLYLFDVRWHSPPLRYTTASFSTEGTGASSRNGIVHDDAASVSKTPKGQCSAGSAKSGSTNGLNGGTNGYTVAKVTCKEHQAGTSGVTEDTYQMPAKAVQLKERANKQFEGKNYWAAINLYNQALAFAPHSGTLYANRAAAFLKRGWYGDIYAALRDCHQALKVDPSNSKASYRQVRCLFELGWVAESDACLTKFKATFPDDCQTKIVRSLERDINAAMFSETEESNVKKESSGSRRSENPSSRRRRNVLVANDAERELRKTTYDYKARFCGHCNTTTDIKEANFFGTEGEYIVAGSDDGSFFIWEKSSTNLMRVLKGDDSIVNCLQPHPSVCLLATSGIDPVVRLWSPQAEEGEPEKGLGVPVNEFAQVAKDNQRRMKTDPFEVMLLNLGYTTTRERATSDDDDSEGESGHVPIQCHTS